MNLFGSWIWECAEAILGAGPRQLDVSELIGVASPNTIKNWSGDTTPNIDFETIRKISVAFGVTTAEVVRRLEESADADSPKGTAVTSTIARARRSTGKLMSLPVRKDRPTL